MSQKKGLKTLEGVYTPTLLTILGVILYLRLGWVVGSVGFGGTLIIIFLAHVITVATALSMSSILTNFKIGSGGAYAIITHSLGFEMGGAIGIPLYISQALGTAFYITGFSEIWLVFFPNHSVKLVGITVWVVLTVISLISARVAFRLQYGILIAIILSLISFLIGPNLNPNGVVRFGVTASSNFWNVFAIFFPAVTGILTGATMSGELENPRQSIIYGTLGAVATGLVVYIFVAYWFAHQATPELLINDSFIILKLAKFKIFIILGVMGAILSSALSSIVSAPRTLSALAENKIIPFSKFFSHINQRGEPVYSIILTSSVSLLVIVMGDLNSLAELLTMFFLTSYGMINLVVFLENLTGIVSFRPSMKLPIIIPAIGVVGCFSVMVLINFIFTIITFGIVFTIYTILVKKNFSSPIGDIRGAIFIKLAEWASRVSWSMPYHARLWKPAVAIPVEKPEDFRRISRFISALIYPSGRLYYLSVQKNKDYDSLKHEAIESSLSVLREENIFIQKTIVTAADFEAVLVPLLECLQTTALPPNMILFTISENDEKREKLKNLITSIRGLKISVGCLWIHPKYNFGLEKKINIWLRDRSPNNDLAVLCALQISKNFGSEINLCRVIENKDYEKSVHLEMEEFIVNARLPENTKIKMYCGDFKQIISEQSCDLSILGMPLKYEHFSEIMESSPSSILFLSSSGLENALI